MVLNGDLSIKLIIKERHKYMLYSKETALNLINYRINLLRARGEQMNEHLINALIREARNIENENKENK